MTRSTQVSATQVSATQVSGTAPRRDLDGEFHREFHVRRLARARYGLDSAMFSLHGTALFADLSAAQQAAYRMNEVRDARRFPELAVRVGELYAAGLLHELLHLLIRHYREEAAPDLLAGAERFLAARLPEGALEATLRTFSERFPPTPVYLGDVTLADYYAEATDGLPNRHVVLEEVLLLYLANENPALERFQDLFDDRDLREESAYERLVGGLRAYFATTPPLEGMTLFEALRAPALENPTSLEGQLEYLRRTYQPVLGQRFERLFSQLLQSLDVIEEERKGAPWGGGGPGPSEVMTFEHWENGGGVGPFGARRLPPPAYERFSPDSSWMPRVVMLAKSSFVWLEQLSKRYGRHIQRLDGIPDEELDELAGRGFTALWLIGLWERSEASRRIKHLRGNPEAVASAYALYDYAIAADLGGDEAYENLRERAWRRGIRLASDMVPNHVGIDGKWVMERPDYFLQLPEPPYPGYTFGGPDLSSDSRVGVFLEDHYWDSSDAAVVFKRLERYTGEARYLYHGNDGTTFPWNDTVQLNYLNPEAREAVMQTILHVARKFPIIRFDAAMTLAKEHIQRLWFPEPGEGGAIPSRAQYGGMPHEVFENLMPHEFWREVVDRVAQEVPDTLLLAEAFWMMEPYFVRTLGMHRVYNSAFMHMFKNEQNAEYRQSIKNTLEFDPEILKRFVNFMNNPDEETAVNQFGKDDKYFGVCLVMSTLPGLPMFGHGQFEGFHEKYGMEYRRAKLSEEPDPWLVERHEREIVPLLHRRAEFAEVEHFALYDLVDQYGGVNENVFAYSNRLGDGPDASASLVVYNNSYQAAAGWLKHSAPYKDKASGALRTRDLAEALGLTGEAGRVVLLKDHIGGLEYLQESARLAEAGLYCQLGGYQYQVFVDIHERHDADGRLTQLARALEGRGAPSLAEALAELEHQPLYSAHAGLLAALGEAGETVGEDLARALDLWWRSAQEHGLELPDEEKTALLVRLQKAAAALRELRVTEATPGDYLGLVQDLEPIVLTRLLVLDLAPDAAESLRLEPYLQRTYGPRSGLLSLFLQAPEMTDETEQPTGKDVERSASARLTPWLERSDVRAFLRVNLHEGTEWFDRDAFRLFACGLALVRWLERETPGEVAALASDLAAFERLELASGYRLEGLAKDVADVPSGPDAEADDLPDAVDEETNEALEPDETADAPDSAGDADLEEDAAPLEPEEPTAP